MKSSDIQAVKFNNNEVSALYMGSHLIFKKKIPAATNILAGSYTEAGDYSFKYNNGDSVPIQLNDDLTFSMEVEDLTNCREMFRFVYTGWGSASKLYSITAFPSTSNVTDMRLMFYDCQNVSSLNMSSFDTANVTNMTQMFYNCQNVSSLDVSNFNTSKVENMKSMFEGCSKLTSIDVTNFNTSKVSDMSNMFKSCSRLSSLDLSSFNTSNVTTLAGMFESCSSLTSIDLSNFNTSKVETMGSMFKRCSKLTSLDLSNFDTPAGGVAIDNMFDTCSLLTTIMFPNNFNISKSNDYSSLVFLFFNCTSLTTVTGTITGIKVRLPLEYSPLTNESAMVFINGLDEVSKTTTITFKADTYNTLTEEQIAIATSRGWSVVSA